MSQPGDALKGAQLDNGPDDMPPPPEFPPGTAREKRDLAIAACADAFRRAVEDGHLQPLSPTYFTKKQVQDQLDALIREYDEEKHNIDPESTEGGGQGALDRLVSMEGGIDALQTLRYQLFGRPLDLRGES
jgi:hypothetical protein